MFRNDIFTLFTSTKSHWSMRKNEKPHSIHVDIKPASISYAHCSCQAGAAGSCSHVVGYVLALQQWQMMGFADVPTQLTCTSLPEQWSVPRGTKIVSTDVSNVTFVNPKLDRKKKPKRNELTDCRKIKVEKRDIDHLQSLSGCPISYLACDPVKMVNTHVGCVPIASGLSTHAQFFEPQELEQVGTSCGNLQFPRPPVVKLLDKVEHSFGITNEQCVQIEENTRDQSDSSLWFKERRNRLTASNFGAIIKRKKVTEKFLDRLRNPKQFNSASTSYGKNHEKNAVQEYIKKTGNHVHECGLIINPDFPFLGATPDGKVCEGGKSGLIEVKCPYSARDLNIEESCSLPAFCLDKNIGEVTCLKENHVYYHQVQGQLMVSGADFCDFVVFTRKDLFIRRFFPDIVFMQDMLNRLCDFYFSHIQS